jgi:hypothetical protein
MEKKEQIELGLAARKEIIARAEEKKPKKQNSGDKTLGR